MALSRTHLLLTDELKLPARTPRDVFGACTPQFDLVDKDLTKLREDLSNVRGEGRVQRLEACIRNARRGQYLVQLLSGHPGSGKSTELRWLTTELSKQKEGRSYHAVFVDLQEYLDVRDTQLPELVTALFSAIVDDPILGAYASASATAKKLWRDLVARSKAIGLTLDAAVPLGVAELKLNFKTSPGMQKRYREKSRDEMKSLMSDFGDLVQDVRSHLVKQGVDDLVIIADNLERVERLPLGDGSKRTTHDLLFLEQLPLIQGVPVHLIVTIPVSLHFTQGRLRQVFQAPNDVVIPMIAVRARGEDPEVPNEAGVAALRGLLAKRVDIATVFADDAALRHAVMQSGGCIRDLLRIVSTGALMKKDLHFSRDDVDAIVKEFVGNMERLLQGRSYLRDLHHVMKTGFFPDAFDDDLRQWLLYELVVLEYNGDTWYDVHPFARRTHVFQLAAPPPVKKVRPVKKKTGRKQKG
jgi:energy-coupling factor transporter ATP-binding protein EcfA2